MANDDLVIQQAANGTVLIMGVLDANDVAKQHTGIHKQANTHTILCGDKVGEAEIRHAVMESIMHDGTLIDDKHVKFANPIIIHGIVKQADSSIGLAAQMKRDVQDKKQKTQGDAIPLADPRIEQLFAPQSDPEKDEENQTADHNTRYNAAIAPGKRASDNTVTITYTPGDDVYEVLSILPNAIKAASQMIGEKHTYAMVKQARSYVNTPFFEAMADARVDGNKIGLDLPIKIEFGNERLKEAFLLMGKRREPLKTDPDTYKQHKDAAKVMDALSKSAVCRAPVAALLARTRRGYGS